MKVDRREGDPGAAKKSSWLAAGQVMGWATPPPRGRVGGVLGPKKGPGGGVMLWEEGGGGWRQKGHVHMDPASMSPASFCDGAADGRWGVGPARRRPKSLRTEIRRASTPPPRWSLAKQLGGERASEGGREGLGGPTRHERFHEAEKTWPKTRRVG